MRGQAAEDEDWYKAVGWGGSWRLEASIDLRSILVEGGGGGRMILATMLHENADCSNGTCTAEGVFVGSVVSRYLTAV